MVTVSKEPDSSRKCRESFIYILADRERNSPEIQILVPGPTKLSNFLDQALKRKPRGPLNAGPSHQLEVGWMVVISFFKFKIVTQTQGNEFKRTKELMGKRKFPTQFHPSG